MHAQHATLSAVAHANSVTLDDLQDMFAGSPWIPMAYNRGDSRAFFRNRDCGHAVQLPWAQPDILRCPTCASATVEQYREFRVDDRVVRLRGKPRLALEYILSHTDYGMRDIVCVMEGGVPTVAVEGHRSFTADLYIPRVRVLVQAVDYWTLGVVGLSKDAEYTWLSNCAKARACAAQGYRLTLMLFNAYNELQPLPKRWRDRSHAEILAYLSRKGRLP